MTEEELQAIQREFGPIRPRALSVLSVAGIVVGGSWLPFGILSLLSFLFLRQAMGSFPTGNGPSIPFLFVWFPLCAILVGTAGLYYGRRTLQLSDAARQRLQLTYYAAAAMLAGFCFSLAHAVTSCGAANSYYCGAPSAMQLNMAAICCVLGVLFAAPCIYAARKLGQRHIVVATQNTPE